ncbi:MAG: hypothetical protein KME30_10485 [Iphinoe sp. HA4291-MV1]|nr:hypothetical protein [Iphinoe sp. HA4291-MV1]
MAIIAAILPISNHTTIVDLGASPSHHTSHLLLDSCDRVTSIETCNRLQERSKAAVLIHHTYQYRSQIRHGWHHEHT